MTDPVTDTIFKSTADSIDQISLGLYRDQIELKEWLKAQTTSEGIINWKKYTEAVAGYGIWDFVTAPYKALLMLNAFQKTLLGAVDDVISALQGITSSLMNVSQSSMLCLQKLEAQRLSKTMGQISNLFNEIQEYQAVGAIISQTFSGDDGFPDPLSHLYGEMKDKFADAKSHFDAAFNGDDEEYKKGMQSIQDIVNNNYSDQGPEFINNVSKIIEIVDQLGATCAKVKSKRSEILVHLDAISQGVRRFRDEVHFDQIKDLTESSISGLLADAVANMDGIPTQCKNRPKKYVDNFLEAAAAAIKINNAGAGIVGNPAFDKAKLLNFENPDVLLLDDEIDPCYAKALQLYAALKKDIDKFLGTPVELGPCHGMSSDGSKPDPTTDVNFDAFDNDIEKLCIIAKDLGNLYLGMLLGMPGSSVTDDGTKDISIDIANKTAEYDNHLESINKKFEKVMSALNDFSFFPFADPEMLSGFESTLTMGGEFLNGLDLAASGLLWGINPDEFLMKTPIGYIFVTLRECLKKLFDLESPEIGRLDFLDEFTKTIKGWEAEAKEWINDFAKMLESVAGLFSQIISFIDSALSGLIAILSAIFTICDFPLAESWAESGEDAKMAFKDSVGKILTQNDQATAGTTFPPVYKNQPTVRTLDAPLAEMAAGLCKEYA